MIKYYSADWIFPIAGLPIQNGIVAVNANGEILNILTDKDVDSEEIVKYSGAIVPGFINTHCHLELSHMKGKISEKTGLVNFVEAIVKSRNSSKQDAEQAMETADTEMYNNGIVAVGDISNQIDSKTIKLESKIYYHTFVEVLGFNPDRAEIDMDLAKKIQQEFLPLKSSIVPHAPYSVSEKLLKLIKNHAAEENNILSIHNQETIDEHNFFINKTGGFLKFYKFLNIDISNFKATGKNSLMSYLPILGEQKTLLVHNTQSNKADIEYAKNINQNLYWCLCPNANLHIEDQLPDVELFNQEILKITLGTDSLASNHQLNILSEMMVLQENKNINLQDLLKWATINGASFLGIEHKFGTIEIGKQPGLNLIQIDGSFRITSDKVEKII